ncbi:hypothetical protein HMI55_002846, partial [Coelomomyces lativittatus]
MSTPSEGMLDTQPTIISELQETSYDPEPLSPLPSSELLLSTSPVPLLPPPSAPISDSSLSSIQQDPTLSTAPPNSPTPASSPLSPTTSAASVTSVSSTSSKGLPGSLPWHPWNSPALPSKPFAQDRYPKKEAPWTHPP